MNAFGDLRAPAERARAGERPHLLLIVLIVLVSAAVVAVHWPALSAQAVTFDDQQYVTDNYLVQNPSWASVRQFFAEVLKPSTVQGYYQPLAMTSLMLDYALAGRPDNFRPFHRTSLALHVLNTALVIVFLYLLFGQPWVAAGVGLLFGVHPLTVEPIAWLGERKTVLAAFFALLCLILYVEYARRRNRALYGAAIGAFALALLSKPTTTPIPALLLLLDYWPLRRLSWRTVAEKVPFFVIAGMSAIVTVVSQARSGAVALPHEYGPWRIPLTLCHNIIFYLCKIVWPTDLSPHYAIPDPFNLSDHMLLAGVIGTAILIPVLLISWRWTRAWLTGWLFFFVAILPTTGIIGFTIVIGSDKYAYLPSTGLLMILAYSLSLAWMTRTPQSPSIVRRVAVAILVLALATLAAAGTRRQLSYWQNTEGLYLHMLAITPTAAAVNADLALEYSRQGRSAEAIQHYRLALQAQPGSVEVLSNLGKELGREERVEEAIKVFTAALQIDPDACLPHWNLAVELAKVGRTEEAIEHYQAALRAKPDAYMVYDELATVLAKVDRLDEAIECLNAGLRVNPNAYMIRHDLAVLLARRGRTAEAIEQFRAALRGNPEPYLTHVNLGMVLAKSGQVAQAAGEFSAAMRLRPELVDAPMSLASCLFGLGRLDEAADRLREIIRTHPDFPGAYVNLGRLLEQQGQRDQAIAVYEAGLHAVPNDATLRTALDRARSEPEAHEP